MRTDAQPRPHPEVSAHTLDDELVLYHPRSVEGHVLNATASYIWQLFDG